MTSTEYITQWVQNNLTDDQIDHYLTVALDRYNAATLAQTDPFELVYMAYERDCEASARH